MKLLPIPTLTPLMFSQLTAAQLEFEFNQAKQIISQQLGVTVNGAATPGNPDSLFCRPRLAKYFQYVRALVRHTLTLLAIWNQAIIHCILLQILPLILI